MFGYVVGFNIVKKYLMVNKVNMVDGLFIFVEIFLNVMF